MNKAIRETFSYAAREEEGMQTPMQTIGMKAAPAATSRCCSSRPRAASASAPASSPAISTIPRSMAVDAVQGAGATHAWADVYLPGAGWVEYDPTNGVIAGENLIRVAVTRDARRPCRSPVASTVKPATISACRSRSSSPPRSAKRLQYLALTMMRALTMGRTLATA